MGPTKELIDDIFRERVLRARRIPLTEKLLMGPELFAGVCQRMADGIRDENPDADEQCVQEMLQARLDLLERLRLL